MSQSQVGWDDRRFRLPVVAIAAILAIVLVPLAALAANTTRETGTQECDWDKDVITRVRAKGDHRHARIGVQTVDVDLPDDGLYRVSTFDWNIFAMQWGIGNQVDRAYDWSGSFAYCA